MIPALVSSVTAQRRTSKGLEISVFQAMREAKLSHCASFKINVHNSPTYIHFSRLQTQLLFVVSLSFLFIAKGQ